MASNRAVIFMGPMKMEIQDKGYPKLEDPKGRKIEHAVILKLVTTNICGSDLHIYHGRFAAPSGMVMGHENTGEVVEIGSHVESIKKGDLCSVPFNVACGTCRSCRERHTTTYVCAPTKNWDIVAPTASTSADGKAARPNT
jgi:glutathione-independent formaldehyde dehydrogenase